MSTLRLSFAGAVAEINLDRPGGNRIDFAMRQDLRDAVGEVRNSAARVLIVRGAGADFSRGGDVREWVDVPSANLRPKIEVFANALHDLRALPIPTVAFVQGACMGGGFELALSCDFILASDDATFRFPEAASGILTLQGGVLSLAERIGRTRALELALLTEPIPAARLEGWNVINRLFAAGDAGAEVAAFVDRLANVSPAVCAATKSLLRTAQEAGYVEAMRGWYDVSMPLFDLSETQEALRRSAAAIS